METIHLKYPVVLVHGIHAHDRKSKIKFWGRIPDFLQNMGIQIFFGNTDAWGGYESNSRILKETIDKILKKTKKEKVNIIAHSKGGIDSRYLIREYNYGSKIASLTTICTPHHGSDIADLIFKQKIVHTELTRKAVEKFGELYGDKNPDLINVNYQLTTQGMEEFNKKVPLDESVYFQSLYTTMDNAFDDMVFFYPYLYIKKLSGDNDGLVSENSARMGANSRKIQGSLSHAEIIDLKQKNISGIDILEIYKDIVLNLCKRGF
jgi:triacylglycerol lipase